MTTEVDYKDTLNLPSTDFPMKANLAQREPSTLARWEEMDLYHKMIEQRDPNHAFILHDGPPYANGDIHIGHALNKILKDIVLKSKALSGFYIPYIPGWDCHGLPIELKVENKIGKAVIKEDARKFRQQCREFAKSQIDIQRASFKRLGVLGDWENPYTTMDYSFEANIVRCLGAVIKNGYLVRGDRPVHWCVLCGSTLADAEVDYMDKTSDAIDVLFTVKDLEKLRACFGVTNIASSNVAIVIWTTTPWTLPANEAVAVNPKLLYSLVQYKQQYLIIASELVNAVMQRAGASEGEYKIAAECRGENLEHLLVQHPFYEKQVPIILGDHVSIDTGTGAVHTAPAHGLEDYIVGQHYNLPVNNMVDANGCFFANTPMLGGQHVFKANAEIIRILRDNGHLLVDQKITHSYPHCLRHKEPLIFRATQQWFISMEANDLRGTALNAIKKISWVPTWGETRLSNMIAVRPDWCISRQRTWGTPLALVIHKETATLHPRMVELIAKVADMVEQHGVQAWYDLDLKDLLPANEVDQYQKVTDMLDVWFDSGVVYNFLAKQSALYFPADLYLEGSDQHRGWFQSSLLASLAISNQAAYKQVLTHGFVVDAEGRKMSKSLGNVVAPEQVIKTLGADVLRLWVSATDYRSEVRVSDEILKRTSDAYRRIRNTARFLLANLHDFNPQENMVAPDQMLSLDRWIVEQARQLQTVVKDAYSNYDFHIVYQRVHNFCSDDLGSFYLDVIKDRQYTCKTDGIPRRSAQTALYHIAEALVRWIAPILCFTADEIWQFLPGERAASVFLSDWYEDFPIFNTPPKLNDAFWSTMLQVRDQVNKVLEASRNNGMIGSGLEAEVTLYCEADLLKQLASLHDELRFVLITSQAKLAPLSQAGADVIASELPGLSIAVRKSAHEKCQRCWHRTADVNHNQQYPHICGRCVENITTGEQRAYA